LAKIERKKLALGNDKLMADVKKKQTSQREELLRKVTIVQKRDKLFLVLSFRKQRLLNVVISGGNKSISKDLQ
jgi:hypothetical protein